MATLKSIRKRILSVKNTQKITKAMKMVSAAKLRRAQMRLVNARPYAQRMEELISHIAHFVPPGAHPLLTPHEPVTKAEFLILSTDRGLCGGFNGNLLRQVESTLREGKSRYQQIQISIVGKKGRDFFVARKVTPDQVQTGIAEGFDFQQALKMADEIERGYTEGKFDEFYIAFNHFLSAVSQKPVIQKILPFEPTAGEKEGEYLPEYLYEPSRSDLLKKILPQALATLIYRAFLESIVGEYAARMAAMDAATNNCREMIRRLTLQLNRLRQAAITKELMDIVNGKEALE